MKNKLKIILAIGLVTFGFSSCDKYLSEEPDMRTEINSVEKVAALLSSAYPKRNYLTFAEVASDNAEDKTSIHAMHTNEPFPDLYMWNDPVGDGNGTPTEFWNATYEAIASANHALRAIAEGDFGTEANVYKGEALMARAYNHFMLALFFAKPYVNGGTNNSPGIPYVTEPGTVVLGNFKRGTVEETFQKIEADLEEGLPLLTGGQWKVPKYHFTPSSAHAFAARFYLFKKQYDKVISHVSSIIPSGDFKSNLRPINSTMLNYTFAQWQQEFGKADKAYNLLIAETYSIYQRSTGMGGARYAMGENILAIHNGNTVFGAAFRSNNAVGVWTAPNYMLRKFYEYMHYTNVAAQIGFPYMMQSLLTVDETLMNRAEAYVQTNQFDLALRDLNDFASVRITNYNPTTHGLTVAKAKAYYNLTDDKEALMKSILDVKRIAFMQEGIRWMDIVRLDMPVKHNHIDLSGLETFTTLEANDPRRVFQIPSTAINLGIEPNAR